jgi:uncharacterized integral membrane protein
MGKTVSKLRLIDGWRIGENESWLFDMAGKGLHLKRLGTVFAHFEKGAPQSDRYRFDVSGSKPTEAQIGMFREGGWDFVCTTGALNVFISICRSPESANAPELHTDPDEQAFTLRKLRRRLMFTGVMSSILAALIIALQIFTFLLQDAPILWLVEGGNSNMPIVCLLYLLIVGYIFQAAISIHRLMRLLREGKPIDHQARWKRHWRFGAAVDSASAALMLVMVASSGLHIAAMTKWVETLPLEGGNTVILRLADVEQNSALERKPSQVAFRNGVDYGNKVQRGWSIYALEQYEANENGIVEGLQWPDGSGAYSPSMEYRFFRLAFPFMANKLMLDLAKDIESWNEIHDEEFPLAERSMQGFERVLTRESGNFKEVFAHEGCIVVYGKYCGELIMDEVENTVMSFQMSVSH